MSFKTVRSTGYQPSTTGITGAQDVKPSPRVSTEATTASEPAVPSGAPRGSGPARLAIDGYAQIEQLGLRAPGYTPNWSSSAAVGAGVQNWMAAGARGYIESTCTPMVGGWKFTVDVHHCQESEPVNVFLSGRATDFRSGRELWHILGTLHAGAMSPSHKDGTGLFVTRVEKFVSLEDINRFYAQFGTKADGTPKLQFRPGDVLSVDATWVGHDAGGRRDATMGYFEMEAPLGAQSAMSTRLPGVEVKAPQATKAGGQFGELKPVELTLALPQSMVDKYPGVLVPGAKRVSRREIEAKTQPQSFMDLKDLVLRLGKVCDLPAKEQQAELKRIFGQDGWHIERTDRYYKKDSSGQYELYKPGEKVWHVKDKTGEHDFDFAGLPKVAGMHDDYQDTPPSQPGGKNGFDVARMNGAIRFRDGEIKAGKNETASLGKLNIKPGGGVLDPTCFQTVRIEDSVDTLPGIVKDGATLDKLVEFLDTEAAPYNPLAEFKKANPRISGSAVTTTVATNDADRYKVTFKHDSGLELEMSMDFCNFTSVNDVIDPPCTMGKSVEQKYQHWKQQFQQKGLPFSESPGAVNKGSFLDYTNNGRDMIEVDVELSVGPNGAKTVTEHLHARAVQVELEMDHVQAKSTATTQSGASASSSKAITNQADLLEEFARLSDDVSLAGPPSVHNLEDLANPDLYTSSSYLEMKQANLSVLRWGFPEGHTPGRTRQKMALALEMMGQIDPEAPPTIKLDKPAMGSNINVGAVQNSFSVAPVPGAKGGPSFFQISVGGYPIKVDLTGEETAEQIARTVASHFEQFFGEWSVKVSPQDWNPAAFEVTLVSRS